MWRQRPNYCFLRTKMEMTWRIVVESFLMVLAMQIFIIPFMAYAGHRGEIYILLNLFTSILLLKRLMASGS